MSKLLLLFVVRIKDRVGPKIMAFLEHFPVLYIKSGNPTFEVFPTDFTSGNYEG